MLPHSGSGRGTRSVLDGDDLERGRRRLSIDPGSVFVLHRYFELSTAWKIIVAAGRAATMSGLDYSNWIESMMPCISWPASGPAPGGISPSIWMSVPFTSMIQTLIVEPRTVAYRPLSSLSHQR